MNPVITELVAETSWLPMAFFLMLGLAVILYAILDGYDLGVGMLLPRHSEAQRDRMIASIGPFWDANETWLVLAVGLLLIAFPVAHNIILRELYIPSAIMLIGLILRGVSFDFRAKAIPHRKRLWDWSFKAGSIVAALSQGYMLGRFTTGFDDSVFAYSFSMLSAFSVAAAYAFIGAAWLIMKTEGELQIRSIWWARRSGWLMALGTISICVVNITLYPSIYAKWLAQPLGILLLPVPLICVVLFIINDRMLKHMPFYNDGACWLPFFSAVSIFLMCFIGLGFSYYPYVVPNQLTIWQAASADESLAFLFYGAAFVVPTILAYTIFSYRVFWGKAEALEYV